MFSVATDDHNVINLIIFHLFSNVHGHVCERQRNNESSQDVVVAV